MTASRIRDLNDRFRRLRQGHGRLIVTAGVNARGPAFVAEAICAVRRPSKPRSATSDRAAAAISRRRPVSGSGQGMLINQSID